ncbi:MAG: hypothetical protein K2H46_02100 [Muribaculaceae bacterium]|nr:hypothetical protein [Muribaculaceae bacterium]
MKQIFTKLSLVMVLIIGFGFNSSLYAQESNMGDEENVTSYLTPENPDPAHGNRMPPAPIVCLISKVDGVEIAGVANSEIVSFEILDAYGNTVALLQDEPSFIETIFSLNGEYRIVFRLQNKILSGWINKTIS